MLLLLGIVGSAVATEQRYDYDALGRLVRSIGVTTSIEYVYDAAGNLLEVKDAGAAAAPVVTSVTPPNLRRGSTAVIRIEGSGFSSATVTGPAAGFVISGQKVLPTSIEFTLAAAADVALGSHIFTVANAAGNATATITINPGLPVLSVAPLPLAVAPDNVPRSFNIGLSNADSVAHIVNLTPSNAAIATVSPASLSIAPGQTSVFASITGVSGGSTTLTLTSPTLQTVQVPVFVTAEFAGINTSNAPLVGVILEKPFAPPIPQNIQLGSRADVGVVVGGHIRDIAPQAIPQGTSATITLFGKGLETAVVASLHPADGVTLGGFAPAPDGLSATLSVTASSTAPATLRQIILTDSAGLRFAAARADSDRLLIAYPAPVVESVMPVFGTVGAPSTITLRGRNLQQGKVQLSPGTGIQIDGAPVVSADGRVMTFNLGIGSFTALGEHLVTVTTPGGVSQNVKGPQNTFTVVTTLVETITPITAPQVGVLLQPTTPPPVSQNYGLGSFDLGIAKGSAVTRITPRVGIVGETVNLSIQGQELSSVTALSFTPAEGISVQSLTPAPDGKSVSASIAIAATAIKTVRGMKVLAGTMDVPFSDIFQSQFLVSAPLPRVDSVTPINLAVGTGPIMLTVRGANFKDASVVSILPASDISVSQPPTVSTDGTVITVNLTIAATAATGQRVVTVTTPAGTTDTPATPGNTLNLVNTLGDSITPIQAPVLGVMKLGDTPPSSIDSLLMSVQLGVLLQTIAPPPATQDVFLGNTPLGVAVGPVGKTLLTTPLRPGVSGTLTVSGMGLDTVTSVSVNPATGITLGTPVIQPDGLLLSMPVTLAADAPAGVRELQLGNGTKQIHFTEAAAARFIVATGEPRIDSIAPILGRQGDTVTFTVRGAHLGSASVLIEPAVGVVLGSAPVISTDGTQLTLGLYISADAALGGRVIRIQTPGGITTDQPEPANTFTVFPP